jgi:hypothetical protein
MTSKPHGILFHANYQYAKVKRFLQKVARIHSIYNQGYYNFQNCVFIFILKPRNEKVALSTCFYLAHDKTYMVSKLSGDKSVISSFVTVL